MAITIADIANDCGVSVSTVSRVMNDSKAVSDESVSYTHLDVYKRQPATE